jgi:translation elongation factor aEF-1 beta
MGKISCVYKLSPEDSETDLEEVKEDVRDVIDVEDLGEEEIAFGLKAVKVSTITTDEEGGTDAVEEQLEKVEGVQSIELEHFDKM